MGMGLERGERGASVPDLPDGKESKEAVHLSNRPGEHHPTGWAQPRGRGEEGGWKPAAESPLLGI